MMMLLMFERNRRLLMLLVLRTVSSLPWYCKKITIEESTGWLASEPTLTAGVCVLTKEIR